MADSGVVLASGGFSRSEELLEVFAPAQGQAVRIGARGNTGDGLRMAWRLGADVRDMGFVKGTFGAHPSATNADHKILLSFYEGAIIVNRNGERFVDESVSYKLLGDECLAQPGSVAFQVWDQAILEASESAAPLFDLTRAVEDGLAVSAPDLPGLAREMGVNASVLVETVSAYNRDVEEFGRDRRFGRDGLCNHTGDLRSIEQSPFYAYESTSALLATYCGVRVDQDCAVIDVYDEPIEGLYAAGEIVGGFHGRAYMTGTSLGKAAIFGRVAAASAMSR